MPTFSYTARDAKGAEVRGKLEAASRRAALAQLQTRKLAPSRLVEGAAAAGAGPSAGGADEPAEKTVALRKKGFTRNHGLSFLRSLMGLVTSGIQVADGVRLLSKRLTDPALKGLASAMWDQLSQGRSLSQAMALFPDVFEESTVNLVQAGEATGRLGGVLERIVLDLEERKEIRAKLISAMAYPAFIMGMAVVVILIFLFFLLPRIETLLSQLHGNMPLATRLLIGFANFLVKFGPFLVLAGGTAALIFWGWRRKPEGRLASDGWLLKVTGIGPFLLNNDVLRLVQALSLLLENGISTLPALALTEKTLQNRVIRGAFSEARGKIAEGAAISTALKNTTYFPDLIIDIVTVGENTGNIVPSLKEVARLYRAQISKQVSGFMTFVSVGVLLVAFGFVALVAFGIISAVFGVSSSLRPGG